jgi:hypothetical protein
MDQRRERTCHKWMKNGAKLHSFVSIILDCSLATIEEKRKSLNTHTQMDEEEIKGERDR